jgi:hypothetical protein
MISDDKLKKVLDIWINTFEDTQGNLNKKQRLKFLNTEETKKLSQFSEEKLKLSIEYAYSINTSKLKDIYDIAVNEKYKPKLAQSINVDANKVDLIRRREADNKKEKIYSPFCRDVLSISLSEEDAKILLDYLDLAEWVKFWIDGEFEKIKCGGGQCGIDSNGKLKKIYKFAHVSKNYKKLNQYIYKCDLNLGFHIATYKDPFGDRLSIGDIKLVGNSNNNQDYDVIEDDEAIEELDTIGLLTEIIAFDKAITETLKKLQIGYKPTSSDKGFEEILDDYSLAVYGEKIDWSKYKDIEPDPDYLIQDLSTVQLDKNGEILLGDKGYPIHKKNFETVVFIINSIRSVWDIEPVQPEIIIEDSYKKIKIDVDISELKTILREKNGDFALKQNGEGLFAYPKIDEKGFITLDEDDNIVYSEIED